MKKAKFYTPLMIILSFCFLFLSSCTNDEEIKPDISNTKSSLRALDQNAVSGV